MNEEPRLWRWGQDCEILRQTLREDGVLAIPTGSSYGLAVDPRNKEAVSALYDLKVRERDQPLPVVAGDISQLDDLGVRLDIPILRRATACWPAPLTVVARLEQPLPASAGGNTLAVRVPSHQRLRTLLLELGMALTATSANKSGEQPILEVEPLRELLRGTRSSIVDDGRLEGGPPSTIVQATEVGVQVLREGGYPLQQLRDDLVGLEIDPVFSAGTVENSCG